MDVLLLKVAILGLLAPRQARSARHEPLPRVTRVAKVAEGLALPGCPEKCGDMAIPYPFGIGKSCSFPGFEMQCLRTPTGEFHPHVSLGSSSRVRTAPVVNISLFPAKVHILMRPASTCNPSQNVSATPLASEAFSLNYPFMFSSTETLFTVVGCNTLGSVDLGHLGCAALCDATLPNTTGDGRCSGVGCCQVAVAPSLRRFFPQLNDLRMTLQMSYLTECVSAFLVESGKYSFKKDDFNMDISDRSYPVVLDWSIRNILDDAKLETGGTYSWRGSPNSVCLKSATGFGHTCKCATGFQGNPYLPNGCQDIDECEKSYQCMGGRICLNLIGNYTCVCPNGTIDKGMGYPCMHKDQKYLQIPIGDWAMLGNKEEEEENHRGWMAIY